MESRAGRAKGCREGPGSGREGSMGKKRKEGVGAASSSIIYQASSPVATVSGGAGALASPSTARLCCSSIHLPTYLHHPSSSLSSHPISSSPSPKALRACVPVSTSNCPQCAGRVESCRARCSLSSAVFPRLPPCPACSVHCTASCVTPLSAPTPHTLTTAGCPSPTLASNWPS